MADVYPLAGLIAAQIAGEDPELTRVAEQIAARARSNALANNDVDFAAGVEVIDLPAAVRRSVRTRAVIVTDPLAAPKELGHVVRNQADGPVLGYVKGLHYLHDATRQMPEDSGD